MENLAHSASLHPEDNIAPSNPGIKHVGVQSVQFRLDSNNIGNPDPTAPYTISLDTRLESDGVVGLSAVATDLSGNQATSSPITVTIDNGSSLPPLPPPPSGTIRVPEDYATSKRP
jgi:hypothetical protein